MPGLRQCHFCAMFAPQLVLERFGSVNVTVHQANGRLAANLAVPAAHIVGVTVRRKSADGYHLGSDLVGVAKQANLIGAVNDAPSQRSVGPGSR